MSSYWIPGFIGGAEIVIIFLLILLLFGADSIPGIAKTFGKGMREFRNASDGIKREFENHSDGLADDIKKVSDKIKKEASDIDKNLKKG